MADAGAPESPPATAAECPQLPRARDFRPPPALRSPHLQSLLGSIGLRRWLRPGERARVERHAREHLLDCGEGVRLQGFHTATAVAPSRGLVVLLHGWEGSVRSGYVLETAARLLAEGFDVFRLNFRDHGDTHHLNHDLFHSCRLREVVAAVAAIARELAPPRLAVAGFSLGGNFALRVALQAPAAGVALDYALAVCPIVSPAAGLFGLEGAPWFYQRYFLHKWRRSLRRKRAAFPSTEWFTAADLGQDLRGLTRALVLRHTSFGSLEAYLHGYSIAGAALRGLRVPATILTAADDPVIPIGDFHSLELPPQVELDVAAHGGHCGFLESTSLRRFTGDYIAARMRWHLAGDAAAARKD